MMGSAGPATDADVACRETFAHALSCLRTLLTCPTLASERYLPLLVKILALFSEAAPQATLAHPARKRSKKSRNPVATQGSAQAPAVPDLRRTTWHATLRAPELTCLVELLPACSAFFSGLKHGADGSFELEVALLQLQSAVADVPAMVLQACGVSDVGVLMHLPQLQRKV